MVPPIYQFCFHSVHNGNFSTAFGLAVCKVLDIKTNKSNLIELYNIIVNEMIMIKGLK